MKHIATNFVEQFDKIDPRKIMTKDTYKYISSLHRRHIFTYGKYGCRSNFIVRLSKPTYKWYVYEQRLLFIKKHFYGRMTVKEMYINLNRRDY